MTSKAKALCRYNIKAPLKYISYANQRSLNKVDLDIFA